MKFTDKYLVVAETGHAYICIVEYFRSIKKAKEYIGKIKKDEKEFPAKTELRLFKLEEINETK